MRNDNSPAPKHYGNPRLTKKSGWYFVQTNSGDRWISYYDPLAVGVDPDFGQAPDDEVEIAGPIVWPE